MHLFDKKYLKKKKKKNNNNKFKFFLIYFENIIYSSDGITPDFSITILQKSF